MAHSRTTKGLAKRIAMDYFKKPHWFRVTKSRLARLAVLVSVLVGVAIVVGVSEHFVSPGPVSEAHAKFESECVRCHGSGGGVERTVLAKTSDKNCLRCHQGPIHHETQLFTPACAECHSEHRGRRLAQVRDRACTRCHANLAAHVVQDASVARAERGAPAGSSSSAAELPLRAQRERVTGSTTYDPAITDFSFRGSAKGGHHPEFRGVARDPGRIRLNHKVHLNLKGKALDPLDGVPLTCTFCHQPDASQRLKAPVSYDRHCAACHPLSFDFGGRFEEYPPGPLAPHDTPRAVRLFLKRVFSQSIAENPARIGEPDFPPTSSEEMPRRLPGAEPEQAAVARTPGEWVDMQVQAAEKILYRKDCALCHVLPDSAAAGPGDGAQGSRDAQGAVGGGVSAEGSPVGQAAAAPGAMAERSPDGHAAASQGSSASATAAVPGAVVGGSPAAPAGSAGGPPAASRPASKDVAAGSTDAPAGPAGVLAAATGPAVMDTAMVPGGPAAAAEDDGIPLPVIAPPAIPGSSPAEAWLRHARFDHRSHRFAGALAPASATAAAAAEAECIACHVRATDSTQSGDVLVPGIAGCAECHRPGKARSDCALCHVYHDKTREVPPGGSPAIPALARAGGDPP